MNFLSWLIKDKPEQPPAPVVMPRDFKAEFESYKTACQKELDKWKKQNTEKHIIVLTTKSGKIYRSQAFESTGYLDHYYSEPDRCGPPSYCRIYRISSKESIKRYINNEANQKYFNINNSHIAQDRIESIEIEKVEE